MKKVTFFLSALALVAFSACNSPAEEAPIAEPTDTGMDAVPAPSDDTNKTAPEEVDAEGTPSTAE